MINHIFINFLCEFRFFGGFSVLAELLQLAEQIILLIVDGFKGMPDKFFLLKRKSA